MPSNPYHPSASQSQSRFPFASRLSRQQQQQDAPLFYSATDDFQEDDEGEEHEREVADFYALQRSRRHFGPSNLTESEEMEEEGQRHDRDESRQRGRAPATTGLSSRDQSAPESESSAATSSKGKGRLVDVDLASTIHENEPPDSLANLAPTHSFDDPPAPFQTFHPTPTKDANHFTPMLETDSTTTSHHPHPPLSPDRESVPPTIILPSPSPPRHDAFWATLFQISSFALLATFILIWFHTSTPKTPLGDTLFSALRGSTNLLAWDTFIAILVALIWLALLRNYVRTLVFAILVAVPVVLVAFSLYPLIASFRGSYNGHSIQDRAMRWLSPLPAIFAAVWTWNVITSRHSLARSVAILEFATRILAASPYLLVLGFATLAANVVFTWTWMLMFERIFLSGHFSSSSNSSSSAKKWVLDANTWWLAAFFILHYLWTLGVLAGLQRASTAATVSQWYFHRFSLPQPGSREVVKASLGHSFGALFGTICLGTFVSLLVRLPVLLLPGRVGGLVNWVCFYWLVPTSVGAITDPLTLTYAAVHSQPLGIAARGLGQLGLGSGSGGAGLGADGRGRRGGAGGGGGLVPYRLAKLLLQSTRWIMSFALGMAGWVRTARNLELSGPSSGSGGGVRGSLYAYVVGLIAGTIGFAVLGAVENVVGAVLDAVVVCWASETGGQGRGKARFCREAGELFGEEGGREGRGGV